MIRKSNFELLRIFAMFGIVLHHLMVNDLDVLGYNKPYNAEMGEQYFQYSILLQYVALICFY